MGVSHKNFLNYILGVAIVSGIARVALDYLSRMLDISPILYYCTFLIAFILEIVIIVFLIKKYKAVKGSLTLIDAIKTGVIIMGTIGLFYCSMAYVYDTYIDPDFVSNMTLKVTERFSPEQLDQVKENLKNQDTSKSYIGVIMYTIWFVFVGAVISLIAGSVYKTNKE